MPIVILMIGIAVLVTAFGYSFISSNKTTYIASDDMSTVEIQPDSISEITVADPPEIISDSSGLPEVIDPAGVIVTSNPVAKKEIVVRKAQKPKKEPKMMMQYKDGIYKNSVPYSIPYGYIEPMNVKITLSNQKIIAVNVTFDIVNPTSEAYQLLFLDYYKDQVVGKEIENVSLARFGGASLSNGAFDTAVAAVKRDSWGMGPMPMMNTSL